MARTVKKRNQKQVVVLVIFLVIFFFCGIWVLYVKDDSQPSSIKDTPNNPQGSIDYSGPTKEEKAETEAHKEDLAKRASTTTTSSQGAIKEVVPFLSFWGQERPGQNLKAGGYISGIIEDAGKCTLLLEKDGRTVTVSIAGKKDASTTSCSPFNISYASLSPGAWSATLRYDSSSSSGVSAKTTIEVQ